MPTHQLNARILVVKLLRISVTVEMYEPMFTTMCPVAAYVVYVYVLCICICVLYVVYVCCGMTVLCLIADFVPITRIVDMHGAARFLLTQQQAATNA